MEPTFSCCSFLFVLPILKLFLMPPFNITHCHLLIFSKEEVIGMCKFEKDGQLVRVTGSSTQCFVFLVL